VALVAGVNKIGFFRGELQGSALYRASALCILCVACVAVCCSILSKKLQESAFYSSECLCILFLQFFYREKLKNTSDIRLCRFFFFCWVSSSCDIESARISVMVLLAWFIFRFCFWRSLTCLYFFFSWPFPAFLLCMRLRMCSYMRVCLCVYVWLWVCQGVDLKSYLLHQKSPIFSQKSPIFSQKGPAFHQ